MTKRIGILTGGGDAPGLNAVIRAVVRVAIAKLGWQVYGVEDGFEGLLDPPQIYPLTLASVRGLLPRGGTILGTTNRGRLLSAKGVNQPMLGRIMERLEEYQLEALIVAGGEGSLKIAQALVEVGAHIVAVPKTIDNDLGVTDFTFGFDTAIDTATDAVDRLHTTAESHDRVMIVEVMGRDVGWIALYAGIAGGADVILIPEIPFAVDAVASKIRARVARGAGFSIVVVAEGARQTGDQLVFQAPGRLGGVAQSLADQLEPLVDREVRVVVLGHLQRGGSPSAFDRLLATRFGAAAVRAVEREEWGQMIALRGTDVVSVPIKRCVAQLKTVPVDGQLVQTARDLGINLGDEIEPVGS